MEAGVEILEPVLGVGVEGGAGIGGGGGGGVELQAVMMLVLG